MDWLDPNGKAIMTENRRMTFYSGTAPNRQFDLDIKLTAITQIQVRRRERRCSGHSPGRRTGRTAEEGSCLTCAHRA